MDLPAHWPFADGDVDWRFVQPYEATKTYLCPGCEQDIPPRAHHIVAVPRHAPELRRHWHRGCWNRRHDREPRRSR